MRKWICALVALLAITANAKVTLPKFFADNMVLQQQSECNIWGWAEPGTRVCITTSWDKKGHNVMANKDGQFSLKVKTPEAGGPYFIGFKDKDYVQISNVMIGEVWIWLFTVKRHVSLVPETDVTGQWNEANSASVRDFSATAYYFGKALRQALGVPIGLICTSWGGSACEAWMAPEWLKAFPKVKQTITEEDMKKLQQRCPTALYYGQLKPLIGYTMRGAIWYQGEDNIPRYDFYAPLMKAMVEGWRKDWKQGDFPFYYCQIAPYDYSLINWEGSQYLREQQQKAESMISNARMAVLMDAGLEYGIHPRKKRQAGERLALLALSNTYEVKGLPDFAVYKEVTFQNDTAVVAFDRSKEWVYFEHGTTSKNFEVAGADKVFHPATKVWVSRNRVYVVCDKIKKPVAVRYAFKDWVDGDLMHDGLPVSSFRTDNWDKPTNQYNSKEDYNNPK